MTRVRNRGLPTFSFHSLPELPIEQRLPAIAGAGFTGIGLSARRTDYWLAEGHSLGELSELVQQHGLDVTEMEVLRPFGPEPDPHEAVVWDIADLMGTAYVQVIGPTEGTFDETVARVREFADRAAGHGVTVGIEFLPWTNIRDAPAAQRIIDAAQRDNLGVCVDIWHLVRGGSNVAELVADWPRVVGVQLNDGPLIADEPDLFEDCKRNRLVPGEGEFDIAGLVDAARDRAPDAHMSLEVLSTRLRASAPEETCRALAQGCQAVLAPATMTS